MSTKYWLGQADAVTQVHTGSIDSVDATPANNTFTVTIGGVAISAVGDTDVATTATNLRASLNASTHPYFSGITWSGATGDIIGTADTSGAPFVAALTETGAGTGAVTDFAATTASAGPCDWSTADNWSDGAIPANGDSLIFRDSAVNVCYGLDNNALTLVDLIIEQTYTGKIGLNRIALVTSADGDTVDTTKAEYREDFLRVDVDNLEIGQHVGAGTAAGSGRIKITNESTDAAIITIFATAAVAAESRLAPVRLKTSHANTDIYIRAGSVGLGIDEPAEDCTIGGIYLNGAGSKLYMGSGASFVTLVQSDGLSLLQSDATVTSIKLLGGNMTTEGDFTVTTFTTEGGVLNPNHIKSAANAITTLNINGGVVRGNQTSAPRTWATVNLKIGGTLIVDPNQVTMTALNDPTDEYTVAYS